MNVQFQSGRWAADLKLATERRGLDSLDVDKVIVAVNEMKRYVGQWGVFDRVLTKIGRAIVERRISPVRVGEIIETIIIRRRLPKDHADYIPKPGQYFVVSVMDEFKRAEVPWNWRDRPKKD